MMLALSSGGALFWIVFVLLILWIANSGKEI